ncbi:MAG: MATE family efflux transporter [Ardenticatenaceae bacterium]|nr:MATE family efflux transporter [Ardenticatenaceae bacterium]
MSDLASESTFKQSPHKTLISLSIPVLFSLIAEPLTGLIDTAFVAQSGSVPLAALGVGTIALSSTFWVFNFLGIGTQTGIAQALGRGESQRARDINGVAVSLALALGILLIVIGYPLATQLAVALGAGGEVLLEAERYMQVRLFGAPAVLITLTTMGSLRGLQDMKTPLWIALLVNALNILLDWPFIFGLGPLPAMGVAGAALASALSQWVGAVLVLTITLYRLGVPQQLRLWEMIGLLRVGRDLFIRTGMLMLFLLLATRVATQSGDESGAAYQVIRQVWIFSALTMEAFAITGQSLVGYFVGANDILQARRVAAVATQWSMATGVLLALAMIALGPLIIRTMVPPDAVAVFRPAWLIAALTQPINAVAFITDGLHWGTGDYRYLRNGMIAASLCGGAALLLINSESPGALNWIWVATGLWILVRSIAGVIRIWPGVGATPFKVWG